MATPPTFQAVLNRLPLTGVKRSRWLPFKPQCPVSTLHRIRSWNDPDHCPKCGVFLEKSALPYRLWDLARAVPRSRNVRAPRQRLALRVVHDGGREVEQHGNGAEAFEA
jgi:Zn-finger nucleic acid-binding protein